MGDAASGSCRCSESVPYLGLAGGRPSLNCREAGRTLHAAAGKLLEAAIVAYRHDAQNAFYLGSPGRNHPERAHVTIRWV